METMTAEVADGRDPIAAPPRLCPEELRRITRRTAEHVLSTSTLERTDRLWPSDFVVFLSNPLSLAYGACGTALFLKEELGGLPRDVEEWILARELSAELYPPGLYSGLAGVALALAELGHTERAAGAMDLAYTSPLLEADHSLFEGAAGWGLASLALHGATGAARFLAGACRAGDQLLRSSEREGEGRFWRGADGRVQLGIAYGTAGAALFLLQLYRAVGDDRFLAGAVQAMEFEIAQGKAGDDMLRWGAHTEDGMTEPYWLHGTSGAGSVLVRFYTALGDERYLRLAERAANGAFSLFTVEPNQFRGLSGIGEFMLDLYRAGGDPLYLRRALRIAESVLCYAVERPDGVAFPGRFLMRITTDLGTGSAGVALFLRRLRCPGDRLLHDLRVEPKVEAGELEPALV